MLMLALVPAAMVRPVCCAVCYNKFISGITNNCPDILSMLLVLMLLYIKYAVGVNTAKWHQVMLDLNLVLMV